MTHQELLDVVLGSLPVHWRVVQQPWFEQEGVAVYQPDIAITLTWGMTEVEDFRESWHLDFPDPSASSEWLYVRYCGIPMVKTLVVVVDGGRCRLPLPSITGEVRYVAAREVALVRLLQDVAGHAGRSFTSYFTRAGFVIRPGAEP